MVEKSGHEVGTFEQGRVLGIAGPHGTVAFAVARHGSNQPDLATVGMLGRERQQRVLIGGQLRPPPRAAA